VRIHLARKHAAEFQILDIAFHRSDIALDFGDGALVAFFHGHVQQFSGIGQRRPDAIQRADGLFQLGAFPAQFLGLFRRIPDFGIFEFAADFSQALGLVIVFKETPVTQCCVRSGLQCCGGSG